ncbi:terminus macrodomain insulation protein YfbV [Alishewanella sp. d11]|uniref:terminus macrodomain insulation protein YfbV n=1 Tax=Alishewanella sp. d11 TaxID=3414030 RepID=UPI003BF91F87
MNLVRTIHSGFAYSKTWPAKPELNAIFPENKIIFLTQKAARYLPVLAILTAAMQFKLLGVDFLGQILAMMLLLVSMPLQGWYWLGVRANTDLPPALINWANEIREQIQKHGQAASGLGSPKNYLDLARLLQQAYQQLDKSVMRRWF